MSAETTSPPDVQTRPWHVAAALRTAISIVALLMLSSATHAAWPSTAADFAALPPYCKARLKPSSDAETQTWRQRLGDGFIHVHHYCAALHSLNQSYRARDSAAKKDLLGAALNEISYVEKNAPANFPLRREIMLKKQQITLMIQMLPR